MIYAFDSYYFADHVVTAAVTFSHWESGEVLEELTTRTPAAAEYVPGEFYKRELPGILSLLRPRDLSPHDLLIVDGYVFLDDAGAPGLGKHLYDALDGKIPVVGVAKKKFKTINEALREVRRGESERPLFVTAVGVDLDYAAGKVGGMAGAYRMPEMLKVVDRLGREG